MVSSATANRQSVLVIPGTSPDIFPWDKYPVPPTLYKYLRPERFEDLTKCLIRFSQRQVFEDEFELKPEVKCFGTPDEIAKYMEHEQVPVEIRESVSKGFLERPERFIELASSHLTAPDEYGVLCLTESPGSDRMWKEYANNGEGFVVAFDTSIPEFESLRKPGRLGKVEYSDEPFSSFLTTYGPNTFFRKRTQYQFEAEWRRLRALKRFSHVMRPKMGLPIYLAPLNPKYICEILIRTSCSVEWQLRSLVSIDARYRHVPVNFIKTHSAKVVLGRSISKLGHQPAK